MLDARRITRLEDSLGSDLVEGVPQVEGVGHGIEHGLGWDVGQGGMQRGGELDAVGSQIGRELQPLLDREVGVGIAAFPRGQLLEGGREDADWHVGGLEWFGIAHL